VIDRHLFTVDRSRRDKGHRLQHDIDATSSCNSIKFPQIAPVLLLLSPTAHATTQNVDLCRVCLCPRRRRGVARRHGDDCLELQFRQQYCGLRDRVWDRIRHVHPLPRCRQPNVARDSGTRRWHNVLLRRACVRHDVPLWRSLRGDLRADGISNEPTAPAPSHMSRSGRLVARRQSSAGRVSPSGRFSWFRTSGNRLCAFTRIDFFSWGDSGDVHGNRSTATNWIM